MGEDGPKVIYRTRIWVRTAVLVAAFLVLLGVYDYTSERYPAADDQTVRSVTDNRHAVVRATEPEDVPTETESSTPESSSTTETTTGEEPTADTTEATGETPTSTGSQPKLTTTTLPGIPVPIPRITTQDGEDTPTADPSSAG